MDVMGDGKINYTEFLIATMDRKNMYDEEMLWATFSFFDFDSSGYITH